MFNNINIKGAAQHNLKNIDVTIPRNKLTVITGLSGSGKSSLAFDTLYAEGQRRYVESLSAYARQFLDRMQKPKVEHIEGLSPAISIEQRSSSANPRSTVATTTEIYDYLRLLYAHIGIPHCPKCNAQLKAQSPQAICEKITSYTEGSKLMILAPYVIGRKGEHRDVFAKMRADGFVRVRIDGEVKSLDGEEIKPLEKNIRHTIEAVVDRLVVGRIDTARLSDSVETALELSGGLIHLLIEDIATKEWSEEQISEHLACVKCDISFPKMQPRNFSFNSPYGACQTCHGLGALQTMDPNLVIVDKSLSISKGLFPGLRRGPRRLLIYYNHLFKCLAEYLDCPKLLTTAYEKLPENIQHTLLHGTKEEIVFDYRIRRKLYKMRRPFEGVLALLQKRVTETESESVRDRLKKYQNRKECPTCHGARLNKASLAVTVGGLAINEFNDLSIDHAREFIEKLSDNLNTEEKVICSEIVKEVGSRLRFLIDVGLNYLTLDRESGTLSGGEAQRIKLATQLGCGLVGVLYILDEPSIGLHQRDNDKLLDTLIKLRDIGNTVIVVEHDLDTIKRADHIIDIGPGAGVHGGEIVGIGNYKQLMKCKRSLTGQFISGKLSIPVPEERYAGSGEFIEIIGAEQNNLKNIDVKIPLGTFCCITGVSGSGKSSLINETLVKSLNQHFELKTSAPGKHKKITGLDNLGKAIVIDQSPIGRTPRSNPVTYTDAFTHIRRLFSETKESKVRGYKPGRFSFNVKGGRCDDCKGDGIKKIAMQFLPDVYVSCNSCGGRRFNQETLSIYFKKKNIADILEMTIDDAVDFFEAIPPIYRKLKTLQDVGLGYIQLGQSATTLSGGEAQRVKLASELAKVAKAHTIYILDEPTTGLHMKDIEQLLKVLNTLRDKDNTVLVIEHNLDVIKVADYIIDLGPEGGNNGGEVIACGTPEEVAKEPKSYTGKYLKEYLN